jgi:hypothetical protein
MITQADLIMGAAAILHSEFWIGHRYHPDWQEDAANV